MRGLPLFVVAPGTPAAALASAVAAAVLVAACSSVPDVVYADGDGGPGTGGEICDDGVDNDGNGKIDCEDPQCGALYACVDAPPDWQISAVADGRPACPSAFASSSDVRYVPGAGPTSCTCTCGTANACAAGDFALDFGGAACTNADESLAVKGTCERLNGAASFDVDANTTARLLPPTPSASACSGNAKAAPTAVVDARVCSATKAGRGCPGSQVCLPRPSGAFALCATKAGQNACPAGYPQARRAGASATDTRTCSGCACGAAPCAGEVKLYDSTGCSGAPSLTLTSTPAPGTCAARTNAAFTARGYTTTITGGGCSVTTPPTAGGSLTFTAEQTICCK